MFKFNQNFSVLSSIKRQQIGFRPTRRQAFIKIQAVQALIRNPHHNVDYICGVMIFGGSKNQFNELLNPVVVAQMSKQRKQKKVPVKNPAGEAKRGRGRPRKQSSEEKVQIPKVVVKFEPKKRGRPAGAAKWSQEVAVVLQKQPQRKRGRPLKIAKKIEPVFHQKKESKQVSV